MLKQLFNILFSNRMYLGTYHEVDIYLDDNTIGRSGLIFSATATNENGESIILVDNTFPKLDARVKRYLLEHEMGHIKYEINENMSSIRNERLQNLKKGTISLSELNADYYAINQIGVDDYIYSVNKLIELNEFIPGQKELMMRKDLMLKYVSGKELLEKIG